MIICEFYIHKQDDDQCNYSEGFLEDQLDMPQTSLFSLLEGIQLSDIIEIWELFGITKSYKHYIILLIDGGHLCTCLSIINRGLVCSHFFHIMMNSKVAKFNIGLIAKRWYLENIQDQYIQANLQDETVGIVTQFQQNNSINDEVLITDLRIFNQLRIPETFTANVKQCLQRKVKYAYGFGKMKKALNLALDLGCEDEIIDMINGFINCKKNATIEDTNNENEEENLQILDPIVQKRRGRPPNKRIKSASESNSRHVSTKNSAINPSDPNLYVREEQHFQQASSSRIPFSTLNTNTNTSEFNEMGENMSKRKAYVCKVCGQSGHNARTCNKQN